MPYQLDTTFGYEWATLELLTLGISTPEDEEVFTDMLTSKSLNWRKLLFQAERHKLLHLLSFYATQPKWVHLLPSRIKETLQQQLFVNRYKTKFYRREAARIIQAFQQEGITFVGTKGISLESTLYGGNGSRSFSDIDWMINSGDRAVVTNILAELGYAMGTFNTQTNRVTPHSRQTLIRYKLNPDHLPSHVLVTNDALVKFVEVDVANSLTWTHCPFQIPVEIALSSIIYQPIPGIEEVQLPCFTPQFQFLFTILHLFKEAWIEMTVNMGKDVNLSKFGDIIRLRSKDREILLRKELVETLEKYDAIAPVVWVLEHLDRTFHTGIVEELGLSGRVTEEWLSSAAAANGGVRRWRGTMRERLYCGDRKQLFLSSDQLSVTSDQLNNDQLGSQQ